MNNPAQNNIGGGTDGPSRLIIDRFEGGYAVCEREGAAAGHIDVPRAQIDARAGEGAIIYYCEESGRYVFDEEATTRRATFIRNLTKDMWT